MKDSSMNVGINSHYLRRKISGLGRYANQINTYLKEYKHNILYIAPSAIFYNDHSLISSIRYLLITLVELIYPVILLKNNLVDKHISPAFSAPLIFTNNKSIVVIHDFAFIDYPKLYKKFEHIYFHINLYIIKKGSHKVVVPSEYVKSKAIEYLGVEPQRIFVISPYSSLELQGKMVEEVGGGNKYFVLLSNGHPRKNIDNTIAAFKKSEAYLRDNYELFLVGTFENNIAQQDDRIKVYKNVQDSELMSLISNAQALLLFSYSEGFGYPVIEAASLGVPSITSELTSLGELMDEKNRFGVAVTIDQIKERLNLYSDSNEFRALLEENINFIKEKYSKNKFSQLWEDMVKD